MATTSATVLKGGDWSAIDRDGVTWYVSNSVSATGAVVLSGVNSLTISNGAVVSGAMLSGGIPTVSVLSGGAMISSTEVNGYLRVASGGIISGNTLNSDEVTLSAGASSVRDVFLNSGSVADGNAYVYVSSGASLLEATMTDGAQSGLSAFAYSGATVSGLTLGSGAAAYLSSGAVAADIDAGNGSVLSMATAYGSANASVAPSTQGATVLTGGTWSAVLSNNTTWYVSGAVSASGRVVLSGISTLTISSGAVVSGATISGSVATVSVMSGGVMQNSLLLNGYVSAMNGATLSANVLNSDVVYLYSGARSVSDTYLNSGSGTDGYSDAYVYSGGSIEAPYIGAATNGGFTVWVSSGASISDPTLVRNGGQLSVSGGTFTTTEPAPCFLAGTLIETENGLIPVEDIRIGDHVMAYQGESCTPRRVIWSGRTRAVVDAGKPDDLSGYPVRVVRDALGEGKPFRDLMITAEHCLFLDGAFIPVRMLVNGTSIHYDKTVAEYEYFHIETEDHAILMSDGALSESYLDTGDRRRFRQAGTIHVLGGRVLTWQNSAAAPLVNERSFVEPIHERLMRRAETLSLGQGGVSQRHVTHDPDLHIVTESGEWIAGCQRQNGQYVFTVPEEAQDIRIVSNRSRPSDAVGPYVDDRRMLGVLVSDIRIYDSWGTIELPHVLAGGIAEGWKPIEACGRRWTDGNASLFLPERRAGGITLLALRIDVAGPYVTTADPAAINDRSRSHNRNSALTHEAHSARLYA